MWRMYGSDSEAYADAMAELDEALHGEADAESRTVGLNDPRREAAWRELGS